MPITAVSFLDSSSGALGGLGATGWVLAAGGDLRTTPGGGHVVDCAPVRQIVAALHAIALTGHTGEGDNEVVTRRGNGIDLQRARRQSRTGAGHVFLQVAESIAVEIFARTVR